MREIKRYHFGYYGNDVQMRQDPVGEFVPYDEHQAEINRLRDALIHQQNGLITVRDRQRNDDGESCMVSVADLNMAIRHIDSALFDHPAPTKEAPDAWIIR